MIHQLPPQPSKRSNINRRNMSSVAPGNLPPMPGTKSSVRTYVVVLGVFAMTICAFIMITMETIEGREQPQSLLNNIRGNLGMLKTKSHNPVTEDWEPFNTTNPHNDTFCPSAKCRNSPLCTPCHRRHFLILSTARSGSTTLVRMFNELPNMR